MGRLWHRANPVILSCTAIAWLALPTWPAVQQTSSAPDRDLKLCTANPRPSGITPFRSATAASARWCSARSIASGFSSTKRRSGWAVRARRDNPEALAALPDVRRLLFAGQPREAYALAERKMMGQPSRLESYQSLGDLRLTFDHEGAITDYRRELDLDAAIARVPIGSTAFATRAKCSPAIPTAIVVRLTVDRPGALTFSTWIDRQQDARTEIAGNDRLDLIGAAFGRQRPAFLASARIMAEGGTQETFPERILVEGANAATIVVAAGTCFRRQRPSSADVDRDLDGRGGQALCRSCRRDHVADHQQFYRRVVSAPWSSPARCRRGAADRRAARAGQAGRDRSRPRRALFPVRPLSADREQPARGSARQPAGPLERQHEPAVGRRLPPQHQPADELLAGRGDQPRRAARAAVRLSRVAARAGTQDGARALRRARLRRAPHHRRLGLHLARRSAALGPVAHRRRLARRSICGSTTCSSRIARSSRAPIR